MMRRAYAAGRRPLRRLRRRLEPARPPFGPPEAVAELERTQPDDVFITGNGIASRCRHVLNYGPLRVQDGVDNNWWFCKADYLEHFFRELAPRDPYVLFSHNGDRTIGRRFLRELRRPRLEAWFAQNPALEHPKLRALPIGIANPRWRHGDQRALLTVQAAAPHKRELFDVSFGLETNPGERRRCLEQTGLEPAPRLDFPGYLERLASAYFCISPSGNGVDSHRTWEALYLRTVPVVTRSLLTDHHPDLPLVVLDDWSQFRSIDFSPELYGQTMGDWTPESIRLDRYLEGVERTVTALRG